jgi:hypothetical protein
MNFSLTSVLTEGKVAEKEILKINKMYTKINEYPNWIQGGLKTVNNFTNKHSFHIRMFEDTSKEEIGNLLLKYYPTIFNKNDSLKVLVKKLNDNFNALAFDDFVLLNKSLSGQSLIGTIFHETLHVIRAQHDPKRLGDKAPDYEASFMMQEELLCFLFEEGIKHPTYTLHKLKTIAKKKLLSAKYEYDSNDLNLWMKTFQPSESMTSWQKGNRLKKTYHLK